MVTTSDGYQFWLGIDKPATTSPDLKVLQGVRLSDSSVCYTPYYGSQCPELLDAPPGKDYIFVVLTVTNKTDRAEPLVVLFSYNINLLVPFGEIDQFGAIGLTGCLNTTNPYATPDPSALCAPDFHGQSYQTQPEPLYARSMCLGKDLPTINQCDLGPGQSTALYVFWGAPIPEAAPTRDVRVYFFSGSGQTTGTQIG
jgi:hypothetical protein